MPDENAHSLLQPVYAEARILLSPSFHEADPMGVVWHGNYLRYFERAREALFYSFDYGYQAMIDSGYSWPVIHVEVDYRHPMRVERQYEVWVGLIEIENRVVTQYRIVDIEKATEEQAMTGAERRRSPALMAQGRIIQMAQSLATQEGCLASPKILFDKLGLPYPWEA